MSIKQIPKTLAAEINAKSIVSFKVNSFKLSPPLFIVSMKFSRFLTSHTKLNLGCVGMLLNIPDKTVETQGCSPSANLSMGSWYSEIAELYPAIVLYL